MTTASRRRICLLLAASSSCCWQSGRCHGRHVSVGAVDSALSLPCASSLCRGTRKRRATVAATGSPFRWMHSLRGGASSSSIGCEANPDYRDDADGDDESSKRQKRSRSSKNGKRSAGKRGKSSKASKSIHQQFQRVARFVLHPPFLYGALAIVAFRRDLLELAIQYRLLPIAVDSQTGQRKISIRWSTDGVKLLLLAELLRRYVVRQKNYQQENHYREGEGDIDSNHDVDDVKDHKNTTQTSSRRNKSGFFTTAISISPLLPLLLLAFLLLVPALRNLLFSTNSSLLIPILTSAILRAILLHSLSGGPSHTPGDFGGGGGIADVLLTLLRGKNGDYIASRHAYLPPLEQHYTFEQLNERYYRDWVTWRKAFPTNAAIVGDCHDENEDFDDYATHRKRRHFLPSLRSASSKRTHVHATANDKNNDGTKRTKSDSISSHFPKTYHNGTVVVMDMTKLDTQASKMESIRDQISFLIQLVQQEDATYFQSHHSNDDIHDESFKDNATIATNSTAVPSPKSTSSSSSSSSSSSNPSNPSTNQLEIILLLESPGGAVSPYGLAASHLHRLRSTPGVTLTICIDTVAASGGYMMACMSSPGRLYCAPFAMVGSIGVMGQSINLQRTLEGYGVRPYVFRGGKMKNPVGVLGDVTKEGLATVQDMVERIHGAFRDHVAEARGEALVAALAETEGRSERQSTDVNEVMDRVATGDVFLGTQAIQLGLVDRLITSDEYIAERIRQGARVLKLMVHTRPVGLSGLFSGPSRRNSPSVGYGGIFANDGLLGILKRIVLHLASSLVAWSEPSFRLGSDALLSSSSAFSETAGNAQATMSSDIAGM